MDYEIKTSILLEDTAKEFNETNENSIIELRYLQTILYAMDVNYEKSMKGYKHHKEAILEDHYTSVLFKLSFSIF